MAQKFGKPLKLGSLGGTKPRSGGLGGAKFPGMKPGGLRKGCCGRGLKGKPLVPKK